MNKKSFTLIEILIASSIFVILVVIGLTTLGSVSNSRSKMFTQKRVQEAGRLTMETISGEIQKVNIGTMSDFLSGYRYYGFAITAYNGSPLIPVNDRYEGGAVLGIWKEGTWRDFKLMKWNGSTYINITETDGTTCPAGQRCAIVETQGTANSPLTSADVNVTNLTFNGYHISTAENPSLKAAYVTILMTVESRWQAQGRRAEMETMTLRTTVAPQWWTQI